MIVDSKQLPVGWSVSTIEDVADVNPRLNKAGIPDDLNVSFVPMPAVGAADGSIDVSGERPFVEVKKGFTSFQEGDVLFAKITPCMENGKMAIVPKVKNGIGFGSTEFHVLRSKEGIDARYIYYFVSSKNFRGEAERYMSGAVGQKRVTTPYIKESEIPVAPPEQQKSIVAEIEKQFSRLDEAVANLKRVKANLKRYKAAVLKAAVEGRLVDTEAELAHRQGRDYETGEQLLRRILETRRSQWQGKGKYKESAAPDTTGLPELPEGWVWATIAQIAILVTDGDHNPPKRIVAGVPHLTAKHVREWRLKPINCTFICEDDAERVFKRYRPKAGDLIVTCVGTVGRTAIVPARFEFSPDRNLAAIRVFEDGICVNLQQIILESPGYQKLLSGASGSTAQPHLYLSDLRALLIPLVPLPEQHRIVAEVDRRLSLAREIEIQVEINLKRAERLRQSILQQAFTGRLVPPGPIGEPAYGLLDGGQKGGKKKTTSKESVSP